MKAVVDNDILIKGACYALLDELTASFGTGGHVGVLGAANFVVPKQIKKKPLTGNSDAAIARFQSFVAKNEVVEPNIEEQRVAAIFETAAQQRSVNLDTGESQLVAIMLSRTVPWLATGDKRAIMAIEQLLGTIGEIARVAGRVKCLEQLIKAALDTVNASKLRELICAEKAIDKSLSICFNCASPQVPPTTIAQALESYIADLRAKARRALSI